MKPKAAKVKKLKKLNLQPIPNKGRVGEKETGPEPAKKTTWPEDESKGPKPNRDETYIAESLILPPIQTSQKIHHVKVKKP